MQLFPFVPIASCRPPPSRTSCSNSDIYSEKGKRNRERIRIWDFRGWEEGGLSVRSLIMAYVDLAFSISDEDIMMEISYVVQNRPPHQGDRPRRLPLLVFGTLGIFMAANKVVGDRAHGIPQSRSLPPLWILGRVSLSFLAFVFDGKITKLGVFFAIMGSMLFVPGFYYTRIAYFAYKGYKVGFPFANIPPVWGI